MPRVCLGGIATSPLLFGLLWKVTAAHSWRKSSVPKPVLCCFRVPGFTPQCCILPKIVLLSEEIELRDRAASAHLKEMCCAWFKHFLSGSPYIKAQGKLPTKMMAVLSAAAGLPPGTLHEARTEKSPLMRRYSQTCPNSCPNWNRVQSGINRRKAQCNNSTADRAVKS